MPSHTADAQVSPMDHEQENNASQDEQDQDPRDGHAQQPQVALTPTLHAGTENLELRTADTLNQIKELTEVGVDFINRLKDAFLDRMKEAREQIEQNAVQQSQEWAMESEATLGLQDRLRKASELVGHLEAGFSR